MNTRTSFLAQLVGLYCVILSLAILVRGDVILTAIEALVHDPSALLVVALVGLVGGLAMVLGHNVWSGGVLPVVVTLIGWWLLIKSALGLFLPAATMLALFETSRASKLYLFSSVVTLLLGVYLLYASVSYARRDREGG